MPNRKRLEISGVVDLDCLAWRGYPDDHGFDPLPAIGRSKYHSEISVIQPLMSRVPATRRAARGEDARGVKHLLM